MSEVCKFEFNANKANINLHSSLVSERVTGRIGEARTKAPASPAADYVTAMLDTLTFWLRVVLGALARYNSGR